MAGLDDYGVVTSVQIGKWKCGSVVWLYRFRCHFTTL